MRALITGGAGFIGYHLANELSNQGYNVVLVDNFFRGVEDSFLREIESRKNITFVSIDLLKSDDIKTKLYGEFDYIYHLAAIIGVQNVINNSFEVLDKNIKMLINMIKYAETQHHLQRFIFSSTSEVYAGTLQYFGMEIPTPENTPLTLTPLEQARTSYMLSKIYGEGLLHQSKLPFTIVRPHNFYGPRMGMSHVIPELLKKAYYSENSPYLDVFSVNHSRTFCYIEDAVKMMRLLAESEKTIGEVYNIGNESPEITILEVAKMVLKITNKCLEIRPFPATAGSPVRRCPNMKKTFEIIGYHETTTLFDGIKKTYDWYKKYIFEGKEVSAK